VWCLLQPQGLLVGGVVQGCWWPGTRNTLNSDFSDCETQRNTSFSLHIHVYGPTGHRLTISTVCGSWTRPCVRTAAALLRIATQTPLKGTCWSSLVVCWEAGPLITPILVQPSHVLGCYHQPGLVVPQLSSFSSLCDTIYPAHLQDQRYLRRMVR
jgi:hypothetical protein